MLYYFSDVFDIASTIREIVKKDESDLARDLRDAAKEIKKKTELIKLETQFTALS